MHLIACCPTINISLSGDVKNRQGSLEGVYTYNGIINGRDYWVKVGGGMAIHYYPGFKEWTIGISNSESIFRSFVQSSSNSTCPNNAENNWTYYYVDDWISTSEIHLNCIGNYLKYLK